MTFTEKMLKKAAAHLGELTSEQKDTLKEVTDRPFDERKLFEKLGIEESRFAAFMNALREEAVFSRELSESDLVASAGGARKDEPWNDTCRSAVKWYIYDTNFPDCNATVESGSWCGSNDACYSSAIVYPDMKSCGRSWE